ncbi:MAG TPA: hypothetical protein VGP31_18565 [Planosporangium sp.]|nr:hypothetical protein [Planosporangium sp.]
MISWAGADTRAITAGQYDQAVRTGARAVREYGKPLLLRFRWEMDRPNMAASMWSPADYVAAWKHVRSIFTAEGASNASWVWCPTNEGFVGGYAPPFCPGDDQVDWVCVDVYAGTKFAPLGELLKPFLEWSARHPTKPIIIGEFRVSDDPPALAALTELAREPYVNPPRR